MELIATQMVKVLKIRISCYLERGIKMKENKKGFTLIELLAVLVVLAILALIAVPIVLNIIQTSREKARLRSVEGFAKAVEAAAYTIQMDGENVSMSSLTLNYDNNNNVWVVTDGTTSRSVEYSGNEIKSCNSAINDSNDNFKLTGCTVGNDNKTIHYTNGQADYDD